MNAKRTDIRLISGGQIGVDLGGLKAGKALGLKTGGTAPHGWLIERCTRFPLGRHPGLADYGLTQGQPGHSVGHTYALRIEQNVRDSDGTIVFGSAHPQLDGGSALTLRLALQHSKPYLHIERHAVFDQSTSTVATVVRQWLIDHAIQTVNIEGNRESNCPGVENQVALILSSALREPLTKHSMPSPRGSREDQAGFQLMTPSGGCLHD